MVWTRHGDTRDGARSPEYIAWANMLQRCRDPGVRNYDAYGGRGISVCERWLKFENFLEDMGRRPSDLHSIERLDNDGDYEPSNCDWSTEKDQARNRRSTHWVEFNGRRMSLAEAVELSGLPYHAVKKRINLRGWPVDRALTEPLRGHHGR